MFRNFDIEHIHFNFVPSTVLFRIETVPKLEIIITLFSMNISLLNS